MTESLGIFLNGQTTKRKEDDTRELRGIPHHPDLWGSKAKKKSLL